MAIKKHIIAFGKTAIVAAHNARELPAYVTISGLVELHDKTSALMYAAQLFENHKHGDSYLVLYTQGDELSDLYGAVLEDQMLTRQDGLSYAVVGITEREALNEEAATSLIIRELKRLKFGVKNCKEDRRQRNGYFDVGWFTPGTVFGYMVDSYSSGTRESEMKYLTVDHVTSNAPNSFLAVSTEFKDPKFFGEGMREMVNIDHVKIIKHQAGGRLKWDSRTNEKYRKEFFERDSSWHFPGTKLKHPTQYRAHDVRQLISFIASPMVPDGQLLDAEGLAVAIIALNVFKKYTPNPEAEVFRYTVWSINKKRLKQIIRRKLNKYLCNLKKANEEYNNMMTEIAEKDFDRDMDYLDNHPGRGDDGGSHYDPDEDRGAGDSTFAFKENDDVELLGDSVTYVDDGETEEGNMTPQLTTTQTNRYEGVTNLGDLLKRRFDPQQVDADTHGNCADIIFDQGSTIAPIPPETLAILSPLVTELNDGVFGKGNWEGGLVKLRNQAGVSGAFLNPEELVAKSFVSPEAMDTAADAMHEVGKAKMAEGLGIEMFRESLQRGMEEGLPPLLQAALADQDQRERDYTADGTAIDPLSIAGIGQSLKLTPHTADVEQALDAYEERMEASHNLMLDQEAEMERHGVTKLSDLPSDSPFAVQAQPGEEDDEVIHVEQNEHGHPQTYLRSEGKEYPVCSQCQCHVMPNRGQGTICDKCAHENEMEQQHDYDAGNLS